MKLTPEEQIARQRMFVKRVKEASDIAKPWFVQWTEEGRSLMHAQITELDITANYDNYEDRIVALFASLAASVNNDQFYACNLFGGIKPSTMVYRRLFTEAQPSGCYSTARFKEIMDRLWLWAHDYYSIADAVDLILDSQEPLEQLQWMLGDEVKITCPTKRLPRLLMALCLNDGGIGQNIAKCHHDEFLPVPQTQEVKHLKTAFCPLNGVSYSEFADLCGLTRETDLFYLAYRWRILREDHRKETMQIEAHYRHLIEQGNDNDYRYLLRKSLRELLMFR